MRVQHRVPRDDLGLGLVRVDGVSAGPAPDSLADALAALVERRRTTPLSAEEDRFRQACRAMLRHGRYRATGRGKPASEYLLRAALEGSFPRVNGPVDANNLVSLEHLVPISLWDLDLHAELATATPLELEVRLGQLGESYVFNPAGQSLELEDLVCGCALVEGDSRPIVTPVKDSLATKLTASSSRLVGCVYYPLAVGGRDRLEAITERFLRWLLACGDHSEGAYRIALPGERVEL